MRKEAIIFPSATAKIATSLVILFLISIVLAMTVAAQGEGKEEPVSAEEIIPEERAGITPDSPLYVFDKIVDNVQLALAKGEDKTKKALEIQEERLAEASVMVDKKKPQAAENALELAKKAAEQAQKELAPDLEKETNENVRKAAKLLSGLQEKLPNQGWEGVEKALNAQLSEEEKVRVALLVSKSRLSYCDAIAQQDFDLMKDDELCQVEKAPQWLKERVEGEFKSREENARKQILDSVSTCIVDPKKCDCSQIQVAKHSQDCEVKKALAIRCEYENDDDACMKLSSEKVEDFLPEFVGKEGKETILAALKGKEEQMFEKFKPPECKEAATFQDCFKIMKGLYGEPPECEGLSDEQCTELMKSKTPEEHMKDFPPECKEAGVKTPTECGEIMFKKYGKPPQCEGLDTKECMKLMRQERPDAANFALPPECQQAGAKEPRQCFDIMTAKFGSPPECEGLDADKCFAEMMKRGPGGPGERPQGGMMQEPPECKEKGVHGKECFQLMIKTSGPPPGCESISADECFQKMMKEGPQGQNGQLGAVHCVGISEEECRTKLQQFNGLPPECAQDPEKCAEAFQNRGLPGGMPAECAGLEKGQCELVMMKKFAPPECREVSSKEECEKIMKEKYASQQGEGGVPGGIPGEKGEHGFEGFGGGSGGPGGECQGLSREDCEQKMFERFAPPECKDRDRSECGKSMREKFEQQKGEEKGFEGRGAEGEHREGSGSAPSTRTPPECQGLSKEDCMQKFSQQSGERREVHDEKGEFQKPDSREALPSDKPFSGPRRTEREPLGAPISGEHAARGAPSECQGLSASECGKTMEEKFRTQQPQPVTSIPQTSIPQQQQYPSGQYPAGSYPQRTGEYPKDYPQTSGDYPRKQYPEQPSPAQPTPQPAQSALPPTSSRDYPTGSTGGYPSSGSGSYPSGSTGGSYPSSGGESSSGASGGSSGGGAAPSTATAVTGQIIKAIHWIGGR